MEVVRSDIPLLLFLDLPNLILNPFALVQRILNYIVVHLNVFGRAKQHLFNEKFSVAYFANFASLYWLFNLFLRLVWSVQQIKVLRRVDSCFLSAFLAIWVTTKSAVNHVFVIFEGLETSCTLLNHVLFGVWSTEEKDVLIFVELILLTAQVKCFALLKQYINVVSLTMLLVANYFGRFLCKKLIKCITIWN